MSQRNARSYAELLKLGKWVWALATSHRKSLSDLGKELILLVVDGEPSPNKTKTLAFGRAVEYGFPEHYSQEIGKSCRWLAVLRNDHPEIFYDFVSRFCSGCSCEV